MARTNIEWCDHSINPIRARNRETGAVGHFCEKVSPGCSACYAAAWNRRVRPSGTHLIGTGLDFVPVNRQRVDCFLDESKLEEVLRRKKPTRYFWCDMTDLFGEWVPDEWIDRCFAAMALAPQHTHLVLTKRAERMKAWATRPGAGGSDRRAVDLPCYRFACGKKLADAIGDDGVPSNRWPLPNVWLGVSVENQHFADERIPLLLQTPAAIRFVSAEPLLARVRPILARKTHRQCGHVELTPNPTGYMFEKRAAYCPNDGWAYDGGTMIDWVIVGGESGPGARPLDVAWVHDIVQQCQRADVRVFVKQLGSHVITRNDDGWEGDSPRSWPMDTRYDEDLTGYRDGYQGAPVRVRLHDRKGGDPSEWPERLRVRQFPEGRT